MKMKMVDFGIFWMCNFAFKFNLNATQVDDWLLFLLLGGGLSTRTWTFSTVLHYFQAPASQLLSVLVCTYRQTERYTHTHDLYIKKKDNEKGERQEEIESEREQDGEGEWPYGFQWPLEVLPEPFSASSQSIDAYREGTWWAWLVDQVLQQK